MELMTPSNPRWEDFCARLAGEEGCNFHETRPGDISSVVWTCKGGTDKSMASAILKDMGCDIEKSLDYFDEHGGYCDCEILFNVDLNLNNKKWQPRRYEKEEYLQETCNMSYLLSTIETDKHNWSLYRFAEAHEAAYSCMGGPEDYLFVTVLQQVKKELKL